MGPLQSSFILGTSTKDNAILAQEVVHHMHSSKSKNGIIAFKIDLEKAYDRVNWDFLELTLKDFNFPESTINLIMWCVKASNLYLLWNGEKLDSFKPSRGLRQGDPYLLIYLSFAWSDLPSMFNIKLIWEVGKLFMFLGVGPEFPISFLPMML